ncbi:MAG: hypothetical protein WC822_01260 [Candidatus Paceibacterota bacterium]|jgi:hypothetical protein
MKAISDQQPLLLSVPLDQYIQQTGIQTRLIAENMQLRDALNQLTTRVRELELEVRTPEEAPAPAQEDV